MYSDMTARSVERYNLEAERLLGNGLNQHQIATLQQFVQNSSCSFQFQQCSVAFAKTVSAFCSFAPVSLNTS